MEPGDANTGSGIVGSDRAHLRVSTILTMVFVGITAIVLAYIGGVMSGRQMAQVDKQPPASPPMNSSTPSGDQERAGEILAPEDLEFARVLRGQPAVKDKKIIVAPVPAMPGKAKEPINPVTEKLGESVLDGEPRPLPPPTELYDYIFQVGAFKDEKSSDNLRQKLEGYGFRTRLERSGKLFIVMVMLRGTVERASEALGVIRNLNLGEPVLRGRKSVAH